MSLLDVNDNYIVAAKGSFIDVYNKEDHKIINIPVDSQIHNNNAIADIIISNNCSYVAVITTLSKQMHVFKLPNMDLLKTYTLPRSASKIRFTDQDSHVLVADKSGDALIYDISKTNDEGLKLFGHLSLLLDILQTKDGKFIVTCDRDEKIRITSFPNTYNIHTYCLGHKEFVNHIELLPHNTQFLISTSGDGFIKIWNHYTGELLYSIDTSKDIEADEIRKNFVKVMDDDGLEVERLPIITCSTMEHGNNSSLIAVTLLNVNSILIYSIESKADKMYHSLDKCLPLDIFPAHIKFSKESIFIYDEPKSTVYEFDLKRKSYDFLQKIDFFNNEIVKTMPQLDIIQPVKLLYKRKFDNVQEYHERKKQRLLEKGAINV